MKRSKTTAAILAALAVVMLATHAFGQEPLGKADLIEAYNKSGARTVDIEATPAAEGKPTESDWQRSIVSYFAGEYEAVEAEHTLPDGARIDILLDSHAIEIDWSKKWAESIGQAMFYAEATDRRAGVVLLVEDMVDETRYLRRFKIATARLGIDLWIVDIEKGRIWLTRNFQGQEHGEAYIATPERR